MSATGSTNQRPISASAPTGKPPRRPPLTPTTWNDDDARQDGADADAERQAEHERRAEQADGAAEQGGQGDEPRADAAELDPQLERAEGEGMVTEHAKISATDPGPEPLPDPEEPEPDHGPADPSWQAEDERD